MLTTRMYSIESNLIQFSNQKMYLIEQSLNVKNNLKLKDNQFYKELNELIKELSYTNDVNKRLIIQNKIKVLKTKHGEDFKFYENEKELLKIKENRLDIEMSNLKTELEAIKTEIESIKKVIEDNIERNFKIFS